MYSKAVQGDYFYIKKAISTGPLCLYKTGSPGLRPNQLEAGNVIVPIPGQRSVRRCRTKITFRRKVIAIAFPMEKQSRLLRKTEGVRKSCCFSQLFCSKSRVSQEMGDVNISRLQVAEGISLTGLFPSQLDLLSQRDSGALYGIETRVKLVSQLA